MTEPPAHHGRLTHQLSTYVRHDVLARFEALAAHRRQKPAQLLRQLLLRELEQTCDLDLPAPMPPGPRVG